MHRAAACSSIERSSRSRPAWTGRADARRRRRRAPASPPRWCRSSCARRPARARRPGERVLAVADELGYRPDIRARLLRRSRSRLLGVVFGVQHAFHGDLVGGLYDRGRPRRLRARAERRHARPRRATGGREPAAGPLRGAGAARPAGADGVPGRARGPAAGGGRRPRACATGPSTSCGPTTRPGSSRPSTTSSSSGTGASRTSTAAGPREPPSAAAATRARCTGTAWGATR